MSESKDIAELRRRLFGGTDDGQNTFYATVESVDETMRTCVVEAEEVQYDDVLLYAVADTNRKGFCFIPSVGSIVLVSRIGGSNELFISMFSDVDRVLLTVGNEVDAAIDGDGLTVSVGGTKLEATSDGLMLTRDGAGLLKTLSGLCDAIVKLTVPTAVGPSGVPANAADFMAIKQELNKYLKG